MNSFRLVVIALFVIVCLVLQIAAILWPPASDVLPFVAAGMLLLLLLSYVLSGLRVLGPQVAATSLSVGRFSPTDHFVVGDSGFTAQVTMPGPRQRAPSIVVEVLRWGDKETVARLEIGIVSTNNCDRVFKVSIDGAMFAIYDADRWSLIPEMNRPSVGSGLISSARSFAVLEDKGYVWALACQSGMGDGIYNVEMWEDAGATVGLRCVFIPRNEYQNPLVRRALKG